ncbi:MAG: sterol carrier family protein [Rhodobacteraceae bacterium]|nr:MAG: sterol carrier family protein [Paracoccaceae bacterium]
MDRALEKALEALREKTGGEALDGSVKLDFVDHGALRLDGDGARLDDGAEADCTISADLDTFRALFDGHLSPTSAFMTGKIRITGDMGVAMRVAGLLG